MQNTKRMDPEVAVFAHVCKTLNLVTTDLTMFVVVDLRFVDHKTHWMGVVYSKRERRGTFGAVVV